MHTMRSGSWRISACLVLLLASSAMALYESNCEGLVCTIKTELALYTFDIHGSRLQLIDSTGSVIPDSTSIGIGFSHMVERMRNVTNATTQKSKCIVPDNPVLNATKKGVQGGELINYLELAKLPAEVEHAVNDPFEGVVTLRYKYYYEGSVVFVQAFSISDHDISYILSNDTRFTGGTVPTATYNAGGLKITIDIPSMPWKAPDTGAYYNSSYLTVYTNFSVIFNPTDLINLTNSDELVMTSVNEEKGYAVQYSFQNAFFVDGTPFAGHVGSDPTYFTGITGEIATALLGTQFYSDLTICKSLDEVNNSMLAHWHNLTYDPNLIALFSTGSTSPGASKQQKGVNIAVAVVVPVVIVAVILVVLIVLFVPAVYVRVLPSDPLKRNRFKGSNPVDDDAMAGSRGRSDTKPVSTAPSTVKAPKAAEPAAVAAVPPAPDAQIEEAPRSTWATSRKPTV